MSNPFLFDKKTCKNPDVYQLIDKYKKHLETNAKISRPNKKPLVLCFLVLMISIMSLDGTKGPLKFSCNLKGCETQKLN